MTDVHVRRGGIQTDTNSSDPRDHRAEAGVMLTSEGTPRIADHQRLRGRHGTESPLETSETARPC